MSASASVILLLLFVLAFLSPANGQVLASIRDSTRRIDSTGAVMAELRALTGQRNIKPVNMGGEWEIGMENFYANGNSQSYFGEGWFNSFHANRRITLFGIPLVLSGGLVTRGNTVDKRLSTANIQFDYNQALQQYLSTATEETAVSAMKSLDDSSRVALLQRVQLNQMVDSVQSQAFLSAKRLLQHKIDSVKNVGAPALRDSFYADSLSREMKKFERQEARVDSVYKKCVAALPAAKMAAEKWRLSSAAKMREIESKTQDGVWDQKMLDKAMPGTLAAGLLGSFRSVQSGSFRIPGGVTSTASVPVNGLGFEIYRKGYLFSAQYGKEVYQNLKSPVYARSFRLMGAGRRVLQVKSGVGQTDASHAHLIYSDYAVSSKNADDTARISFLPRRNLVLTFDGRMDIGAGFFVGAIAGTSSADFGGSGDEYPVTTGLFETGAGMSNKILAAKAGWGDKKKRTGIAFGYQTVGESYVNAGDLFAVSGRSGIRVELSQNAFKRRLKMKANYLHNFTSGAGNGLVTNVNQHLFSGEISWRLSPTGSRVWVQYAPNYFTDNNGSKDGAVYQVNLATAGLQILYPQKRQGQWMSLIQLMNYSDQARFGDTSTITGLLYGVVSHTYFGAAYSATLQGNVGINQYDLSNVKDLNIEFSQNITLGKRIQLVQGCSVVKRYYDGNLLAGGIAGFQYNFKKLSLGFRYTHYLSDDEENKKQILLNSNISMRF